MPLKRLLPFFIPILVLACATGAGSGGIPPWVSDIRSAFPKGEYVARLGSGASQDVAKADALNSISQYFNTKVRSEGTATRVAGGKSGYSESAVQKISVQSQTELFCVEYEFHFDRKVRKFYCAAFISKEKYWKQFQPKIENKKHEFEKIYKEAEDLLATDGILAKKYFMFAQKSGKEFTDLVSLAWLVVEDSANAYSRDEKRVFEIPKRIKDAENAIAIFMDIENDFSNTAASKVKELFEGEKYSFTDSVRSSSHVMKVAISHNELVTGKGTEYEAVSVAPSIRLTLENSDRQNLFSYSRKAAKAVAFSRDIALRKGFASLCKMLEDDLMQAFAEKMDEE